MPGDITPNPMAELEAAGSPEKPAAGEADDSSAPAGEEPMMSAAALLAQQPLPADSAALHQFFKQSAAIRIETPMNLHQAAAYTCLQDEEAKLPRKLGMLLAQRLHLQTVLRSDDAEVREGGEEARAWAGRAPVDHPRPDLWRDCREPCLGAPRRRSLRDHGS